MKNKGLSDALDLFSWTARELPIRFFGDKILYTACEPIEEHDFGTDILHKISEELVATLTKYREHTGLGRGLAANQLGYNKRMIVVWFNDTPQVLCNLELIKSDGLGSYWESCISSGALLVGEVQRPWTGTFKYNVVDGKEHYLEADEKQTRVLLHEIDHLNGITCNEKYEPKTMRIVTGGKEEILSFSFKQLS